MIPPYCSNNAYRFSRSFLRQTEYYCCKRSGIRQYHRASMRPLSSVYSHHTSYSDLRRRDSRGTVRSPMVFTQRRTNIFAIVKVVARVAVPILIPVAINAATKWLASSNPSAKRFREQLFGTMITSKLQNQFFTLTKDMPPEVKQALNQFIHQSRYQNKFWDELFKNFEGSEEWKKFQDHYGFSSSSSSSRGSYEPPKPRGDLYKVLGVPRSASEAELRTAFTKQVQKYHPDRLPKATEEEKRRGARKFQEVMESYAVLKDKSKRRMYDATGRA
eukprot:238965_1